MSYQRLIAFDFGLRFIGVATGQRVTQTATALKSLQIQAGKVHWPHIDALIKEWQPDAIIVGLPLTLDGNMQSITQHAKQFIEDLRKRYPIPVFESDERLTTKEAKSRLFEEGGYKNLSRDAINAYSAKLILESWFYSKDESGQSS